MIFISIITMKEGIFTTTYRATFIIWIRYFIHFLFLICFIGTPPTIEKASTFLLTTAPAAIIAPFPISTPLSIVVFAPIQTLSPITIFSDL